MGSFKFVSTSLNGVYIIEHGVYKDNRGTFTELYNLRDFEVHGITQKFVQDNISISKRGTLRGLHFQKNKPQCKLIKVLQGEIFDVAVDIRAGSKTFGKWVGVILSEYENKELFIPEGFAHGFLALSDYSKVMYKCTEFFNPGDESGILWSDKEIGIHWPLDIIDELILSEKDKGWPVLNSAIFL